MTAFTLEYDLDARIDLLAPACNIEINLDEPISSVCGLEGYATAYTLFFSFGKPLGVSVLPISSGQCLASDIIDAAKAYKQQKQRAELESLVEIDRADLQCFNDADISVIIPTCNRLDLLQRCLDGVCSQTRTPGRIIVVDNSPDSKVVKTMLENNYPGVEYLECRIPGASAARNAGARYTDCEFLAFIDDDVRPSPGWLENLCHSMQQDRRIGVSTGLVLPAEIATESQAIMEALGGFNGGFRKRWVLPATGNRNAILHHLNFPDLGAGCNILVRRGVFESLCGFDETIGAGTGIDGEDFDLYARIIDAGYVFDYEPSAIVHHHHRRTSDAFELQYMRASFTGGYLWGRMARHQRRLRKSANSLFRKYAYLFASQAIHATFKPDIVSGKFRRRKLTRYITGYINGRYRSKDSGLPLWDHTTEAKTGTIDKPPIKVLQIDLCRRMSANLDCKGHSAAVIQLFCGEKYISSLRLAVTDSLVNYRQVISGVPDSVLKIVIKNIKSHRAEIPPLELFLTSELSSLRRVPSTGGMAWRPSVSVVIPTRNRPDDLAACLWRISRQDYDGEMEILVVDNDKSSGQTEAVVKQYRDVEYLVCDKPGSSATRNTGFLRARGEIVVLADDDVLVPPGWVRNMADKFRRQDVWMVNGSVLPYSLSSSAQVVFEQLGGFPSTDTFIEMTGSSFRKNRFFHTAILGVSANMAFRRCVLENPQIGGMSEILGAGLPTGGGEDPELSYRILKEGHTVVFDPSIWVHHQHRKTTVELKRQLFGYGKSGSAYLLHLLLVHKDTRALSWLLFVEPYRMLELCFKSESGYGKFRWTELLGYLTGFPAYFWTRVRDRIYNNKEDRSRQEAMVTRLPD